MHGVGPRQLLILLTGLAMIVAGIVGLAWF
jgi:hypothetical protein